MMASLKLLPFFCGSQKIIKFQHFQFYLTHHIFFLKHNVMQASSDACQNKNKKMKSKCSFWKMALREQK
jgi:hypothetical protein